MRFLEIFASLLAEKLMAEGTQIFVNPDEIKWPDGTISKPVDSQQKRRKKKPNSKDGLYGRLVNELGGCKKGNNPKKESENANAVIVVNADEQQSDNGNAAGGDQPKKKSWGSYTKFI